MITFGFQDGFFHVLEKWSFTQTLYQLDLARKAPKLTMFSATSQSKVEAVAKHYGVKQCLWRVVSK